MQVKYELKNHFVFKKARIINLFQLHSYITEDELYFSTDEK